jgi:hypothetical protein
MTDVPHSEEDRLPLTDHTISMRNASRYCLDLYNMILNDGVSMPSISSLKQDQQEYLRRRQDAEQKFWDQDLFVVANEGEGSHNNSQNVAFPVFQYDNEKGIQVNSSIPTEQHIYDFQERYQHLNLPCLVTGLHRTCFAMVDKMWVVKEQKPPTISHSQLNISNSSNIDTPIPIHLSNNDAGTKIRRQFFLDHFGEDFRVPLRYDPTTMSPSSSSTPTPDASRMDEEGRAVECKTKFVSLKEWIEILTTNDGDGKRKSYYLKDWHFQQLYETTVTDDTVNDNDVDKNNNNRKKSPSLYTCPKIFEPDLLNKFLIKFTNGDYRFLYWGPKGSFTGRHSDVLHSFSWSYNVVGTKQWTFFAPTTVVPNHSGGSVIKPSQFTIRQETGQAIFVPATWQHEVINLEETVSLNHNWISTSNLDLSWECLLIEIDAIQTELKGWWSDEMIINNRRDFVETCENMLRGCVGLDVTSFFLMTLSHLLETLLQSCGTANDEALAPPYQTKQKKFDMFRLLSVLQSIVTLDSKCGSLEERLVAVLQSDELASEVVVVATHFIDSLE